MGSSKDRAKGDVAPQSFLFLLPRPCMYSVQGASMLLQSPNINDQRQVSHLETKIPPPPLKLVVVTEL